MGIREGYRRIPLPEKVRSYLQLIRPFTVLAVIIGGISGALMGYFSSHGNIIISAADSQTMSLGILALILAQLGNNSLNQAMEADLDRVNKPYRPIPRGSISVREATFVSLTLFSISLIISLLVNTTFLTIVASIIACSILYSCPPFYMKSRLWLGYLVLAISRGALGFLASFSIFGSPTDRVALSIASILFVYVFGANSTKDYSDASGDAMFGIRTLPVAYGDRARYITAPFFIMPFIMVVAYIMVGMLPAKFIYTLSLLPVGAFGAYATIKYASRESVTENTVPWTAFYSLFGLLFIAFALSYIL